MQPEELSHVVAENLKTRREELGLTQQQVAEAAEITQAQYSRIEAGKSSPTLATLARIASALRISPDALLTPKIFSK